MPTFEARDRFRSEYHQMRPDQRQRFRVARQEFISVLREWEAGGCRGIPRFPRSLGVKPMVNNRAVMEMAWAADGRCTWSYGTPRVLGK